VQDSFCPCDVVDQRFGRLFDDQPHAHRSREVINPVAFPDQLINQLFVADIVDVALETGSSLQMLDVAVRSGGEIVDHDHILSLFDQVIRQMRADEARSSRDQVCCHRLLRPFLAA